MDYIDRDEFNTSSREIEQNVENTLQRVIDDYTHHWKGIIGESIQNSFDAWCVNRIDRNTIPEDQKLEIKFTINLPELKFTVQDNAGGMPEKTFKRHFAGLDTPGDEKRTGEAGGSYGRGFHVISGLGEWTYGETKYNGYQEGIMVKDAEQMETNPQLNIDKKGTKIEVIDCDIDTLVDLSEWSLVEKYIQERFQPLLKMDDVTIKYVIDGVTHTAEPIDISSFDVLWEGNLDFEYGGEEMTLEDIVIYDATSSGKDVPFQGIQMLKRNEYIGKPFMRVHEYRPRQVKHLDKMFGFADATDLCPKYENNAHTKLINNAPNQTGIKGKLEELENQYFIGTPTDLDEREDLVTDTLNIVNDQWIDNPFDSEVGVSETSELDGLMQDGGRQDQDEDGLDSSDDVDDDEIQELLDEIDIDNNDEGDEPTGVDVTEELQKNRDTEEENRDSLDSTPQITLSCRQSYVDIDSEVTVWIQVENPEGSPYREFEIEGELDTPNDQCDLETHSLQLGGGEGSSGDDCWKIEVAETGKYRVDSTLYPKSDTDGEVLDLDSLEFRAGDPEEEEAEEDPDDGPETISFLEDIKFVRAPDEKDFRAELNEGERAMVLMVNSAHPAWKHAVKLDGTTGVENQLLTLVRWANNSILNRMLLDRIEEDLADHQNSEGEQLNEVMLDFVREKVIHQMSSMVAEAHQQEV